MTCGHSQHWFRQAVGQDGCLAPAAAPPFAISLRLLTLARIKVPRTWTPSVEMGARAMSKRHLADMRTFRLTPRKIPDLNASTTHFAA
jgi:hypothetical protein